MGSNNTEHLVQLYESLIRALSSKWLYFYQELPFNDTVAVSTKIAMFIPPSEQYVHNTAPEIFKDGRKIFVTLLYKAIVEAKTHSDQVIHDAFIELGKTNQKQPHPVSTLNTPIQRIGLLVLVIGLAMLIASLAIVAFETYGIRDFWREVVHYWNRPFRGRSFNPLHYGAALAILGLLLSYLYDQTTGRLIKWIKYGKE